MDKHNVGEFNRKDVIGEFIGKETANEIVENKTSSQATLEKAFDEMLSDKNIEMKTDLTNSMIVELSKAEAILKVKHIPVMRTFVDFFNKYSVSKGRKGREEIVKLTTNSNALDSAMLEPTGFDKALKRLV